MKDSLYRLQNGTDIRGILIETKDQKATITQEDIKAIARGIVHWLSMKEDKKPNGMKIAVGMDSRITGPAVKATLMQELAELGISVLDCGMATTPAMFMTTIMQDYLCTCGIMITASHLPYNYNGFKIFTSSGITEKSDIKAILDYASERHQDKLESDQNRPICEVDLIEDYSKILVRTIIKETGMSKPFENLKIIVDAGNGAGGFFASKVLANLGADTKGSQFLEPDGMFPNHIPNPENQEAMEAISKAVLDHKADIGIIFDTDVDRAAIVADDGMEINKNSLIALISDIVLREHPGTVIVTDSITSDALTDFIQKRGGIHHRFQRGYKNVINEAIRINEESEHESYLAIETSGHGALRENHFLDDGTYLISKILIEAAKMNQEGKKIQSLIEDLKQPYESVEYRLKITDPHFSDCADKVLEEIKHFALQQENWEIVSPNYEGVKIRFPKGWFLMRKSLHEPVMPLNIEADEEGLVKEIVGKLREFVKEQNGIEF